MKPDASGITVASLSPGLKLSLADRWASYYTGEKTVLKLTLRKEVSFWPDQTVLEKELTVDPAAGYSVDFLAYGGEFSQKLEAGKKYYVKYSFKRAGKISKQDFTKTSETGKISYQPGAQAIGR